MNKLSSYITLGILAFTISSCDSGQVESTDNNSEMPKSMIADEREVADPLENKGIGPISSIELGEIDQAMVEEGKIIYEDKCTACHKANKRYIGPAPAGIMERRSPEWIMNMILNPEQMVAEDPIAKELLKEFLSPMANQSLTEEQARKIVEYFRTL